MNTFVLVVVLLSGYVQRHDSTYRIESIQGFTSEKSCMAAGAKIKQLQSARITFTCVQT